MEGTTPRDPSVEAVTVSVVMLTVAASVGTGAFIAYRSHYGLDAGEVILATVLVAAFMATRRFRIHVHRGTKLYMGSVPLYLMATLLIPGAHGSLGAAAAVAAMAAIARFGLDLTDRHRDLHLSDILVDAARWAGIMFAGFFVGHLSGTSDYGQVSLIGAAAVLWAGDLLTSPLVLAPITREKPLDVIRNVYRATALPEAGQYLIGLLGAMAAMQSRYPWAILLLVPPTALIYVVSRRANEIEAETHEILTSLADTVDLRDPLTGGHSRRVADMARMVLSDLRIPGPEAEIIVSAARVHDIGKIGVPDHILLKPGPLTPEEREIMNSHPERGADLLQRYPDFSAGAAVIRHHHEAWDGSGYPYRLAGEKIPFGSRIIAVVDSFDAMTTDRPYRPARTVEQAVSTLRRGRGEQWDPVLVDAFLRSVFDTLPQQVRPTLSLVPDHREGPAASA